MCRCKAILSKTSEISASEISRNILRNSSVNVFGRIIPCVASVSVRFRSKEHEERWTRVKDRAKNGTSRLALVSFLARSFFAPKPNGNACYATQASRITSFEIFYFAHTVFLLSNRIFSNHKLTGWEIHAFLILTPPVLAFPKLSGEPLLQLMSRSLLNF